MLKPLLVIGTGGSGGKTIRAMKEAMNRRLLLAGYDKGLPNAWQFLQFDTTYDGLDFNAPMLPRDEVCLVVPTGSTFASVVDKLERSSTDENSRSSALAGWGIPTSDLDITKGAGMIRGIGRQVTMADADNIKKALSHAVTKMQTAGTSELVTIAKELGAKGSNAVDPTPAVLMITSLSGGSGAGMFVDIAEILKRSYPTEGWAQQLVSFIYTAEVFEGLQGADDVKQNCLGAMNEIIAGSTRTPTQRTEKFYESLGIANAPSASNTTGAKGNILIGSRNSQGLNLAMDATGFGMNEVFLTVGEMLAGVLATPKMSEWLYQQAFVNGIQNSTKVVDKSGLTHNAPSYVHPFTSMGFGRLTLGIDRVMEFTAAAITRGQIETLLAPDYEDFSNFKDGNREEVLRARVKDAFTDSFLPKSGLNERENNDDVIDALKSPKFNPGVFSDLVLKPIISSDKQIELGKASAVTWAIWSSAEQDELKSIRTNVDEMARTWAEGIQVRLLGLVAESIATGGLRFASGLLGELEDELDYVCNVDLKKEIDNAQSSLQIANQNWWHDKIVDKAGGLVGIGKSNGNVIDELTTVLRRYIAMRESVYRKSLAVELLRDLLLNFVQPLRKILSDEADILKERVDAKNRTDVNAVDISNWPRWRPEDSSLIVPSAYRPRAVERTLIQPEEFRDFYKKHTEIELEGNDKSRVLKLSEERALLQLSMKSGEARKQTQQLLSATSWTPKRLNDGVGQKVVFTINLIPSSLKSQNRDWLVRPGSEFRRVANMSIRDFCEAGGDRKLQQEYAKRFTDAYESMMKLAEPLTAFNKDAARKSIERVSIDDRLKKTDKIPFAVESPIGQQLKAFLGSQGEDLSNPALDNEWFDASSNATELYCVKMPVASFPAYIFASLTRAIADSVNSAKTSPGEWSKYWLMRRSRPLPEALPVSPAMVRSIVTGYFVAKIFGLDADGETVNGGKSLKIWNPSLENAGFSNFPDPLLKASLADAQLNVMLPSLLTSIGLAMVNYGESGNEEHLDAYRLLKLLGREVTVGAGADDWDNLGSGDLVRGIHQPIKCTIFADWISNGDPAIFKGHPVGPNAGPAGANSMAERIERIEAYLDAQIQSYAGLWNSLNGQPWTNIPNIWELQEEINSALKMLKDFVEKQKMARSTFSLDG